MLSKLPQNGANFDPSGIIHVTFAEDHTAMLHAKYLSSVQVSFWKQIFSPSRPTWAKDINISFVDGHLRFQYLRFFMGERVVLFKETV
jgi:prepilin-type processing-associated H-X9-DG protein